MSARDAVLHSISEALGDAAAVPSVPREYRRAAPPDADAVALFCERAADYRADVIRVARDELAAALAAACGRRGSTRVVTAPAVEINVPDVETVADDGQLNARELDRFHAALTGSALAIAETGTIVLDGGPASGRRVLTLVPDHHLCVVEAESIVHGVPEAVAAMVDVARDGRPMTLVSGPSATSDIELERVEGVHGPRQLDIFVVI